MSKIYPQTSIKSIPTQESIHTDINKAKYRSRMSVMQNGKEGNSFLQNQENQKTSNDLNSSKKLIILGEGLEVLDKLKSIVVSQQIELWDTSTGCDFPSNLLVYPGDEKGHVAKGQDPLFLSNQISSCLNLYCEPGFMRCLDFGLYKYRGQKYTMLKNNMLLSANRPFKIGCLCLPKAIMEVFKEGEQNNELIGAIKTPFNILDYGYDIYDHEDKLKFKMVMNKLSPSYCCKGLCLSSCQETSIQIQNHNGRVMSSGLKVYTGLFKSCLTERDILSCVFPSDANTNDKALIMMAILTYEYCNFEESPIDKNPNLDD